MEYTHEEYCNVHVKSHYIILVEVVQTLMCFGDRSSWSVGHEFFLFYLRYHLDFGD